MCPHGLYCKCSSSCKPKDPWRNAPGQDLDWHEEADFVGYWPTVKSGSRPELVKKTNYPHSFSLTNTQYRAAMAGRFCGVVVVDSRTGAQLFVENEFGLADVLKTAVAKVADDGTIYWVVRW